MSNTVVDVEALTERAVESVASLVGQYTQTGDVPPDLDALFFDQVEHYIQQYFKNNALMDGVSVR